ncbi:AAA family ATPase [Kocuria rhizophila]|uniref:AAA family ATPase n=1 Tax=Kocuria rhizophila TaxID=72000 RepID=UPI0025AF0847|nr:AAA family ATPase [Kocuria rhizophila]MDN3226322.1 AAA family ATPase [Kocuria rhizophila]
MTDHPFEDIIQPASAGEQIEDPEPSGAPSWGKIDLTDVLNGTWQVPEPTLMARTDGPCLLYPGLVHSFHGESESGKSFIAQAEAARQLQAGQRVLYLDFESDQGTVVNRILKMGTTPAQVLAGLDYRRPDAHPRAGEAERAEWQDMLSQEYALAVLDGVTEAFTLWGVDSMDTDSVTGWGRNVPRRIAASTGAAVVLIDHVTKSTEGRGRFAIGSQAKMNYLTGAAFTVEVIHPLGVGLSGMLSLRVGKDRPGQVRRHQGAWKAKDRTAEIARALVDSTAPERIRYELLPPADTTASASVTFRPTTLMEKLSEAFEDASTMTMREYRSAVSGKNEGKDAAAKVLEAEGYLIRVHGKLTHARRYRQCEDPNSDQFTGT